MKDDLRMKIFYLIDAILLNNIVQSKLYKVMLIIETLQLWYFSVHRNFASSWTNNLMEYLQTFLDYLEIESLVS